MALFYDLTHWWKFFLRTGASLISSQNAHDVKTMTDRRQSVLTLHRCWYDFDLRLCACWVLSSAYNICKQFEPWSDPTEHRAWSDLNCLTLWWYSWKNFSIKQILKKIGRRQNIVEKFPACVKLKSYHYRSFENNDGFKLCFCSRTLVWVSQARNIPITYSITKF